MKKLIFAIVRAQDLAVRLLARRVSTHKLLLLPGIEPLRWRLGLWRALRTFEASARRVPAYREFLTSKGFPHELPDSGSLTKAFATIPEMDKDSYIRKWSITQRCVDGELPRRGVVVDESSGSSGNPTSWVRGPDERVATRVLLQVGFAQTSNRLPKQPFVLNAFSLGAWATGMNVTTSLADVTMIKSIGPDKDKIIATMREFGTDFTYIILSYPPFLKSLFDDERLDWSTYDIVAAFGGEGISENMRAHISRYAHSVFGSYGASDLEINFALETDFTVALRQEIARNPELARLLTRQHEYGVLPMIFQFNPYNYLIETNQAGELLVTITRKENLNPRIRYNIHDRGHVTRLRELLPILRRSGLGGIVDKKLLDFPLLFHYGRSDLSVDFNGAVVAPDTVRDVIFGSPELIETIENHRLISYEDDAGDRQLHIALQLKETGPEIDQDQVRELVFSELRRLNSDFDHAIVTSPTSALPSLACYSFRSGPFAEDGSKLKNEYVWQLAAGDDGRWALKTEHRARP
ncbi:CoF synthetase [Saxibacter everestensis]|uniref:CoF synthetase n=1 Tax=Saxibacter everestensis TaxID=2909229 RepID=A0ABY8QPH9_9MICO|nr:CoF synthetase [Brevibacteriaceae bacterium ZFBP1038]